MSEVCQALLQRGNEFRVSWIDMKDANAGREKDWVVLVAYRHFVGVEYTDKDNKQKLRVEYRP